MSRLTERKNGEIYLKETGYKPCGDVCKSMGDYDRPCDLCPIDEAFKKLAQYEDLEDLEEQGRLIELPCEKVYRIINYDSPKYAFVDRIPIETMPIYDLKHIDNGNIFFSTKEKAEAKLEEWRVRNEL